MAAAVAWAPRIPCSSLCVTSALKLQLQSLAVPLAGSLAETHFRSNAILLAARKRAGQR